MVHSGNAAFHIEQAENTRAKQGPVFHLPLKYILAWMDSFNIFTIFAAISIYIIHPYNYL